MISDDKELAHGFQYMFTLDKAKTDYDDPSTAIIAASFVEDSLGRALAVKLPYYDREIEKKVFKSGALNSFYNRIWVARTLNLVGPKTLKNLHIIREIRNDFAHSEQTTDFNTTKIKTKCDRITLVTHATEIINAGIFITRDDWPPRMPRDKYVLSCILYWNVFMQMAPYGEPERWIMD